jgi:hypothetical protein
MTKKSIAEIAKVENQLPDYSAHANHGFENHTKDDYAVPFLYVVQSNAKIIETNPKARPGMLMNSVTGQLYDAKMGIKFVPCYTQRAFVEWKPRTLGGGYQGMHFMDDPLVAKVTSEQEFGKYKVNKADPNSNDLRETVYVYGLLIDDEDFSHKSVIAFTSTKLRVYKGWMTAANELRFRHPDGRPDRYALYAHRWKLTTVVQKNEHGTFYNFQIEFDGENAKSCRYAPTDPIYLEGEEFYHSLASGKAKANYAEAATSEEEDIPFK